MNIKQLIVAWVVGFSLLFTFSYAEDDKDIEAKTPLIVADQKYHWESEGNLCVEVGGKFNSQKQMSETLNLSGGIGIFKGKVWFLHDVLVSVDFNANGDVASWIVSGPKPLLQEYIKGLERQYKDKSLFYDFSYSFLNCKPTAAFEEDNE